MFLCLRIFFHTLDAVVEYFLSDLKISVQFLYSPV